MFIKLMSPEVKLTVSSGLMFCTGMGYAAGPSAGKKECSVKKRQWTRGPGPGAQCYHLVEDLENCLTVQIRLRTGMLPKKPAFYTTQGPHKATRRVLTENHASEAGWAQTAWRH